MEYENCLVELDEVLSYLSKENLQKIPEEIRNVIKSKKNKEYMWKYDESKPLNEQKLSRKTIAMLSYLNMEYLLNEEQKKVMEEIHKLNQQKFENEQSKKYNTDDLFKNTKSNTLQTESTLMEVKKQKWYKKILIFMKNIFK